MFKKTKELKLGTWYRDKLTGFEGVAIARTDWLYGCVRYGLQSIELTKDGGVRDAQWFDEDQLEPTPTPLRAQDPIR